MITGEKTILRAVERSDIQQLWEWTQDEETMKLRDYPEPPSSLDQAFKDYDNSLEEQKTDIRLAIATLDGQLIGETSLRNIDPRIGDAEFTIAIGNKGYWGHGYGTDVTRTLMRYAFQQLNLHRITLYVHAWNGRAVHAYEKVGFAEEGCLREADYQDGKYSDVLVMGLLKEDFENLEQQRSGNPGDSATYWENTE